MNIGQRQFKAEMPPLDETFIRSAELQNLHPSGARMTEQSSFDTATRVAAGDDGTTYDGVAITLHWLTAALVIANFALSQMWDWFAKPTKGLMEDTHMSF